MNNKHKKYINRAFYLAQKGMGSVAPNPMVGCVIVKNENIIGEGYHKKFGKKHAEINAIKSVKNKKTIEGSSIYITLEPCSHHGKTPPCVDEIINYKPKEVIISNKDPNQKINGKGIKKLKENNINVIEGIHDAIGKELNKRFFLNQKYKIPYVVLKWAETKDSFIAKTNGESKWISNDVSRTLVHKWRSEESGILIGVQTAIKDNPKLTVRKWKGKNPIRIIVDPNNRLQNTAKVLKEKPVTLIYNTTTTKKKESNFFIKINPFSIHNIIQDIYKKGISSIIVEGGTKTINYFIDSNLWHEARIFVSNKKFGKGIIAPNLNFENVNKEDINGDELYITNNNAQFKKPNLDSLEANYKTLVTQINHLIEEENDITAILSNVSSALKETFNFLWVGFYLIKNEELVLGPFQGPVACFRIKKNEGVCGYCWKEKKTIIVPNVNKFPGHIACSSLSKSEIVVPVFKKNDVFAILDVDSKSLNQFNVIDKTYLEKIVRSIEKKLT